MGSIISKLFKPFNFTPWPVTIFSTLIYAALLISLLIVHLVVPSAPQNPVPFRGINISEAWLDLQILTNGFRPYNSRRNDEVRDWLLRRIETIIDENKSQSTVEDGQMNRCELAESSTLGLHPRDYNGLPILRTQQALCENDGVVAEAIIYNDLVSNVTFSSGGGLSSSGRARNDGQSVYFEGTNIIVYIRGSEDDQYWPNSTAIESGSTVGGVLVNAHYDSVSTGFGATDDGVGVVTALQLIKYYTTPGKAPMKGLVILLNNGEEDFLNGARAFTRHPMSEYPHTFLNLEGAGAGGRATLFRSTDMEVTRFYANSPYPFGSVLSADGFKRGLIRSQTDYIVFNDVLGLRGLDVAFMEPRARYHTDQDDTRHTSKASLWHMLSAAISTTRGLTSDTSSTFDWSDDRTGKNSRRGSDGVWFDLYGRALAVFGLRTLFALSIVLLIIGPLTLLVLIVMVSKADKMYFFSARASQGPSPNDQSIRLYGWRGFIRFPLTFIVSAAAVLGLALLITKLNPFIVYSSPFTVWSMMSSAWIFIFWFCLSLANSIRPSSLYRGYSLMWIFLLSWVCLVLATVYEDRYKIAGTYLVFFYFCGVSLATFLTFLECFALPRKMEYARSHGHYRAPSIIRPGSGYSGNLIAPSVDEQAALDYQGSNEGVEEPTETTGLLVEERRTTFANYSTSAHGNEDIIDEEQHTTNPDDKSNDGEQQWGKVLNKWTWLLQLLLLGPFNVILVGQVALLLTSAISQTGADGNSLLFVYISFAVLTTIILLPLAPFLQRFTHHVPLFLLAVFVGTVIYNLVAFPFSANNRYKVYFVQTVELETGLNYVSLSGVTPFVQKIISTIPSAAGQEIQCGEESRGKTGLTKCSWRGLSPKVVNNVPPWTPPELGYGGWLHYNVTRSNSSINEARFHLYGRDTRACKLMFDQPISDFHVEGAARDDRYAAVPPDVGSKEIRLWRREWEKPWDVHVKWPATASKEKRGLDGKVVCLWSDDNQLGVIPALDELRRFAPDWVAFTKLADGLVEGEKKFMI